MKLNPQNALWYNELCGLFPHLKNIKEELKNDNFIPQLIDAYRKLFLQKDSTENRAALNASLKTKLAQAPAELTTHIEGFASKFFTTKPDAQSLETIIPDILLILLARYPLDNLNNKKYDILELMYGACEAESFQRWFDNEEHLKYLYLIEWQAPGLLSRASSRSTQTLKTILAEIVKVKSATPSLSSSDIELVVGRNLKFSEGKGYVRRSALHPVSRFLAQDLPHRNFANSFPYLVENDWPIKRLEELEKAYANFFKYNPAIPDNIDAEKILLIIDKYKLTSQAEGVQDPIGLKKQCDHIIAIDNIIQKGPRIKRPKTMTDDNTWEQEETKCYQSYFFLLFKNPSEKPAPEKTIEDLNQFKRYLQDKTAFSNVTSIKLMYSALFPETMNILSEENASEFNKIKERLFKTIESEAALQALAQKNNINLDEVMSIALRNQLGDSIHKSTSNLDIIHQCRKILRVANQVNADTKDENHKPAMMQIAMQLPDGYKHFKINAQNLEEALYLIKNRGTKSQDELIKELTTVGKNNYQRPKVPSPEPNKETPVATPITTLPETKTLNVQSPPPVVTPTVATPTIVQTIKPQTFTPEVAVQLTTAGLDIQNSFSVLTTLQTKHEVLSKALSDWESRAQQDATEKSELEEIAQEPEVKAYYQMLKAILAQSFLAATVIASGKIDGNTGVGIKAINGLSTLSAAASSASAAVFPLAAPILGFFKVVSNALNSTLTYREMQKHVEWVELKEIPQFAETLARGSAGAQKRSIPLGISRADETTWTKIKNECGLFIEQLKSGVTFSSGEKRALLDAQLLFEYILTHERPLDMTLSGRINILLQHLVGAQATLTSSVSSSNNNSPIVAVAQNNSLDVAHLLKAEIAALKEKHELDQQEQARRLQELHDKIRLLQEQQTPKVESNHVDVGDGQMQLTMQTQNSAHTLNSASRATLTDVYKRLDEHGKAVAELGQQVAMTQEELTALGKSTSGNTATNSDYEDDNEVGACCVM